VLLKSKRFTTGIIAIITMLLVEFLGMDEAMAADLTEKVFWLAIAVIGGQSLTDVASKGKTSANHPGGADETAP